MLHIWRNSLEYIRIMKRCYISKQSNDYVARAPDGAYKRGMLNTTAQIVKALQARKGEWRQISAASGIPYSTLSKLARGKIPSPGLGNINKLLPHLERRES